MTTPTDPTSLPPPVPPWDEADTFTRALADDAYPEKRQCQEPDCPDCQFRNQLRAALGTLVEGTLVEGTLVEGMQRLVRADAFALTVWGACRDPHCTFEQQLHLKLLHSYLAGMVAFGHAVEAVRLWQTLPPSWMAGERAAGDRTHDFALRLMAAADAHNDWRRAQPDQGAR